jgi:SAM-dependent methyltransferase
MTDQVVREWDKIGTYQRNADAYADASEAHWGAAADRLVDGLWLRDGMRVLDVATGPGRAARLAAAKVGDDGTVIAIDTSDGMRAQARGRAADAGARNLFVMRGDMHDLDELPERSVHAASQALSIYLARDGEIPAVLAALRRRVKPGGRMAVSTCGRAYFTPVGGPDGPFARAVRAVSGVDTRVPWQDTEDVAVVADLFAAAGILDVELHTQTIAIDLVDPDAGWGCIVRTGYSRIIEQLDESQAAAVRQACAAYVIDHDVRELTFEVIHAHVSVG